ncbi:MAG: aspartyl protease family protein [Pyrinomonadaceae bacterium]
MNFHQFSAGLFLLTLFCLFSTVALGQTRKPIAIVLFEVSNNVVLMKVKVNGSKPLSFILDTGASGIVISENQAKELGLKLEEQAVASTQGGSIEASLVKDASLRLSKDVELTNIMLSVIRLNGLEAGFGRKIDGILGYEIFDRFVVEIDYVSKLVSFHEPQTFKYSGRGKIFPITVEEGTPFILGKVAPVSNQSFEGKFLIDTGSTGTISLNSPFATRNKLLELVPITKSITFGGLLAGKSTGRVGRVNSFQFGDIVIANPVAIFSQDTEGDDSNEEFSGVIGSEVLRRFKLIIDYSRKQIILEANKQFSGAYEFDMSGASLVAGGEGFKTIKVRSLIENSPATDAGLRIGDTITAINGKPTTEMTIGQIRQMFKRVNQTYKLSVKRNEALSQITLKTRRII